MAIAAPSRRNGIVVGDEVAEAPVQRTVAEHDRGRSRRRGGDGCRSGRGRRRGRRSISTAHITASMLHGHRDAGTCGSVRCRRGRRVTTGGAAMGRSTVAFDLAMAAATGRALRPRRHRSPTRQVGITVVHAAAMWAVGVVDDPRRRSTWCIGPPIIDNFARLGVTGDRVLAPLAATASATTASAPTRSVVYDGIPELLSGLAVDGRRWPSPPPRPSQRPRRPGCSRPPGLSTVGASGLVFGVPDLPRHHGASSPARRRTCSAGCWSLTVYGGILWGLVPRPGISWSGHLFGALGGVLAAWVVHRPAGAFPGLQALPAAGAQVPERPSRAHRVDAAVDVDDLAGRGREPVRQEGDDRAGDRLGVGDVPAERGPGSPTRPRRRRSRGCCGPRPS